MKQNSSSDKSQTHGERFFGSVGLLETRLPNVLVIDDDPVQRTIICKVAASLGYEADGAASYDDALELLTEASYDCITVDLSLGDRDGVEILRMLADLRCSCPVVIISGCDERVLKSTARIAKSLGLNISEPLRKPISLDHLRSSLSEQRELRKVLPKNRIGIELTRETMLHAILQQEIVPFFQAKVELATGCIVGCEALARWNSPRYGNVSPSIFMAAVERLGLMNELTELLLDTSIEGCKTFYTNDRPIAVSVNLSASLLADLSLPDRIEQTLRRHRLPASALILEITESVAMSDVKAATDILVRLRLKGIQVSIDDFGTGYSSLKALAHMPFSEMKIDQTFVRTCTKDPDMMKIVNACISLAKHFNLKTVAEGIENASIARALQDAGCDLGQGHMYSKAITLQAFRSLLNEPALSNISVAAKMLASAAN